MDNKEMKALGWTPSSINTRVWDHCGDRYTNLILMDEEKGIWRIHVSGEIIGGYGQGNLYWGYIPNEKALKDITQWVGLNKRDESNDIKMAIIAAIITITTFAVLIYCLW